MPFRLIALVVAAAVGFALATAELAPRQYLARGGVLLPTGMVKVQYEAADPGTATALVQAFIAGHRDALLVDPPRMQQFLAAAASRYQVVLVATPAAARGPDLQLPAAFSGGALVVSRHPANQGDLEHLGKLLSACRAQVIGTVLSPA